MATEHFPVLDRSLALLTKGYAWLPDQWRRDHASGSPVARTRLLGRPAVALRGPEAVPFFYDDQHIERHPALPEPALSTLFGHGAVHTLDGEAHRVRKAMFVSLLMRPGAVAGLVDQVTSAWDARAASWPDRRSVVVFDEVSEILTSAVCRWAGLPLADDEVAPPARDLVAMVDGFATAGPRHWRARLARRRRENDLAQLVEKVREGAVGVPAASVVGTIAAHRDADGQVLDPRTAAVELLNVIRPTTAICWFVTFAAHALERWPEHRRRLRAGDERFARAFAHEVRRFYPFAPFVAGRALRDLTWHDEPIPRGTLVLLDLYGQDHDERLWTDPYRFDPTRFLARQPGRDELVPQGGGDPRAGHRCPGEDVTVAVLQALAIRLARLEYTVPEQDLTIPLRRVPTRPRSGFVIDVAAAPQSSEQAGLVGAHGKVRV